MTSLNWSVHVTPQIPTTITDLPPDVDQRWWSPTSSTLIYGERDAVLVDPLMTGQQADDLADWVTAAKRHLTTIYITHGHGDHWFGLDTLLKRFPDATAVAVPQVVTHMREQAAPEFFETFWKQRFPDALPDAITVDVSEFTGSTLTLEGHRLEVIGLGHTDTDDTTALWVPSVRLLVAGDAVYNDVHLYLAESPGEKKQQWVAALDMLDRLHPQVVVAGHKRQGRPDAPAEIAATREYIKTFEELTTKTTTTEELYQAMLAIYPQRVNRGALWGSCRATKG